ncbi:MAG: sodium:solute symporter [bacterium]
MTLRNGDLFTIVTYFSLTLGIGFWCMRKNRSSEDYFVGGRRIPGWAVGISYIGAAISSITFLAYPGNAYAKDWNLLVPGLMLPFAAYIGGWIFAPFYRACRYTSAYEYLEGRFSPGIRLYGVVMYGIQQAWRLGSVLYLLSIPIQKMTGWDPVFVILVVGVTTTIYSVVGGVEAVIWTDVMQTLVFLLGGLGCVTIVFMWPGVGPAKVFETAFADNKFNLTADTAFSFTRETIWVLVLWGFISNIQEHVSDQIKIQRYCAVPSDRAAKNSVMFNGVMCIPVWCLFMFIGTCLYAFYKVVSDPALSGLKSDQVFPHFILTRMPVGMSGLVIAGILAAAMSTLSATMNAVATVATVDIYKRYFVRDRDDRHYLTSGKVFSLIAGLAMIVTALLVQRTRQDTFLPMSFFITSVTVGGLAGLFCIGFFSTRTNTAGMYVGIIANVLVTIYLTLSAIDGVLPEAIRSPTHKFMIGVFSNIVCFVVGYLASFFFQTPGSEKVDRATFWTTRKSHGEE